MGGTHVEPSDVNLKTIERGQEDVDAARVESGATVGVKTADAKRSDVILDAEPAREAADHARVHQASGHLAVPETENACERT